MEVRVKVTMEKKRGRTIKWGKKRKRRQVPQWRGRASERTVQSANWEMLLTSGHTLTWPIYCQWLAALASLIASHLALLHATNTDTLNVAVCHCIIIQLNARFHCCFLFSVLFTLPIADHLYSTAFECKVFSKKRKGVSMYKPLMF